MKKNIIFVTNALWIGGIETALVNLLNNLNYDKFNVTLLVLHAELDMLKQINPKCKTLIVDREKCFTFDKTYHFGRLFHLTEESSQKSFLHRMMMWTVPFIKWNENRLYINYVRNLMKNEHFDTAVIYSDVVAEITIRAIKANKYLMFYHHGSMRHVYHDKIGYKKCEKIIAVSKNQANELKKFVPKYANKILAIHNLTEINSVREKSNEPIIETFEKDKFNIVSVGRVSHEKGMDIAVRACAMLIDDGYKNVRWWIIGDGPAMQEVQDVITETNMKNYVITVGMKSNPYPYMKKANLYVQPSRVESYGLTIKEALILDKSVVATDTFGAVEILKNVNNSIICSNDVYGVVESIKKYLNNPDSLEQKLKSINQFEEDNKIIISKLESII
jgi:glycosyltransferase involved in cell wall biosynthesis